ncbi:hypothetical protein [Blastococcus sp. PRF04-17]|uniref:hypothetical protein n=1 Tax=Blastococcus sp. PRF04-17 TaxID=2933797 RepID=UPI001FF15B44|nr:hypothetical protein [Blastococcus sp. PRF04-17]UOY00295.1 hypothetical protein MVA48_14930 [Blastococcus sp. PRF04-17]
MSATLWWPTLTVLGFCLFTGVVVALGSSSTARYEFERNGARTSRPSPARADAPSPAPDPAPVRPTGNADAGAAQTVAVRPTVTTTVGADRGWWLLDESAQLLAGPFEDRIDAEWAALSEGLSGIAIFGARSADGSVIPRPSPEERAWLGELGDQLDRLPEDWDGLLTDTDPLTTLLVEIAAALVEAGLPLHDDAGGGAAGGVCLFPELGARGVLVSWRAHDRMSVHSVRGAAADDVVSELMNATVGHVLEQLGFVVEPYGATGCSLVTALR